MNALLRFGAVAALALAAASTSSLAAGKCVSVGGEGVGVTKDIASFMANAAMKNSAKKFSETAKIDKVKENCAWDVVAMKCTVSGRACK